MNKEELINYSTWQKDNWSEIYLMSPNFMVETYFKFLDSSHPDETTKVSTNKKAKEFCRHCGSPKTYDVFFSKWLCPVCDNVRQNG